MFFLTGKDISSQSSSYWIEGKVARIISYSYTMIFTIQMNVGIKGSDQCRRTIELNNSAVSSHNDNSFKRSKCCSCIGVSELFANKEVCEKNIVEVQRT